MTAHDRPAMTPQEALDRLKAGNERFVSGHARFPTVQKDVLADLAKGQAPYATILGCSDSRVPPELVFDASFGELFVIRVAGNVLGHEGCGAVKAALASRFEGALQRSHIEVLLENIVPALDGLDATQEPRALLGAAVEANVRHTVRQLLATPEAQARLAEGGVTLVGAVYELESGRVRFLE